MRLLIAAAVLALAATSAQASDDDDYWMKTSAEAGANWSYVMNLLQDMRAKEKAGSKRHERWKNILVTLRSKGAKRKVTSEQVERWSDRAERRGASDAEMYAWDVAWLALGHLDTVSVDLPAPPVMTEEQIAQATVYDALMAAIDTYDDPDDIYDGFRNLSYSRIDWTLENDEGKVSLQSGSDHLMYGYWMTDRIKLGGQLYTAGCADNMKDGCRSAARTMYASSNDLLGPSDTIPNTATYKGNAIGLSGRHQADSFGTGHFSADVTLNAEFNNRATFMVSGTITDFQGGQNVNPAWAVTLERHEASGRSTTSYAGSRGMDYGVASGGGKPGDWVAVAYGKSGDQRPSGVYGGFRAYFPDGAAIGAFSTLKQAADE